MSLSVTSLSQICVCLLSNITQLHGSLLTHLLLSQHQYLLPEILLSHVIINVCCDLLAFLA